MNGLVLIGHELVFKSKIKSNDKLYLSEDQFSMLDHCSISSFYKLR